MKATANLKLWHPGPSSRTTSHIEDPEAPGRCCCGLELGQWGGGLLLHPGDELGDYVAAKCRSAAKAGGLAE